MPELSSDLSNFWHGWIVGLTALSLIALGWLTLSVYSSRKGKTEPRDVVWDGDLREETNPAPWWWFILLLGLLVFTVIYLTLYPGLGDYPGMLRWTQESQIEESAAGDAAKHAELREKWRSMNIAELGADAAAMRTAARLFRNNCAACHAEDAGGITAIAPDLTDSEWAWGGSEAQIRQTITAGRAGLMPPMGAALGEDGVREVADFVLTELAGGGVGDGAGGGDNVGDGDVGDGGDGDAAHPGRAKYQQFCAACHGPAGQGNPLLGAPDLSNDLWFYGSDPAAIRASIRTGRSNQMPPQGPRLTETQLHLLVAWLLRGRGQ